MATTPGVGQDIEALCGRCGQVWHVVMAKMGDKIAKVVCKRCGGHHRFRNEGEEADETARAAGRPAAARAGSRSRKPSPVPSIPAFDPTKPARAYAASANYAAGERIAHPTFGVGVVAGSPGAGKIDVIFPAGPRVLAAAKAASSLARPVAATSVPVADRPPGPAPDRP
jgi:hypothetical protein